MHTAFRHFLFSIILSLLTIISSGEMHVSNVPSIHQTEWFICPQNIQPISTSVFVDNKCIAAPSKSVYLLYHFSPFALVILKKQKHIALKTYQYQVASTLIGYFFRLKTDSTTSSDDDLPLS